MWEKNIESQRPISHKTCISHNGDQVIRVPIIALAVSAASSKLSRLRLRFGTSSGNSSCATPAAGFGGPDGSPLVEHGQMPGELRGSGKGPEIQPVKVVAIIFGGVRFVMQVPTSRFLKHFGFKLMVAPMTKGSPKAEESPVECVDPSDGRPSRGACVRPGHCGLGVQRQ